MIYLLTKIFLTAVASPAPAVPLPLPPITASVPAPAVRSSTRAVPIAADTGASPEAAPSVLITEEVLKNYEAVRADFATFWPAHQLLKDSSTAGITTANVMFSGQGLESHPDTVREYNYADLATREPTVAAVFTKHHLAPSQYEPMTIALWQALYVVQLNKAHNHAVAADSTSVAGKNVALVQGHLQDLSAVGLGWHFQQGQQGGGDDGGDLNP